MQTSSVGPQVLEGDGFRIVYDEAAHAIHFDGEIRLLRSGQIRGLRNLLKAAGQFQSSLMHWDFSQLRYLDSTAEHMLYHMLIELKSKPTAALTIQACDEYRVQQKLVPNLKVLFPEAQIHYVSSR
jgi:hypothetical protein